MGLHALDKVFLTINQLHHQQWLEQTMFRTRELQEQLAEQAAANQGHLAIVRALVSAYSAEDWKTLDTLLNDYNARNRVYQSAYYPTYNAFRPA